MERWLSFVVLITCTLELVVKRKSINYWCRLKTGSARGFTSRHCILNEDLSGIFMWGEIVKLQVPLYYGIY